MDTVYRELLGEKKSIRLFTRPNGGGESFLFEILSVAGEGGSVVAYQAVRKPAGGAASGQDGTAVLGILKEYYPVDADGLLYYSLRRSGDGQLLAEAGTSRTFEADCERYLSRHRMFDRLIAAADSHKVLRNYIEAADIYYGFSDAPDTPATVYLFARSLEGIGFDQVLAGIRRAPAVQPEKKLRQILQVLLRLTDAVKAMHTAGVLHLDLKPSNFLAAKDSAGGINPDQLSLFDLNTCCNVLEEDPAAGRTGSAGFAAPETRGGKRSCPDDRSDLYSLGGILFNSIVLCSREIPDGLYRDSFYPALTRLVQESALIRASSVNADPLLCSTLARILEKTLAPAPRQRYNSTVQLAADLAFCIRRIDELRVLPTDELGATDPLTIFQKLLYRHPLYAGLNGGDSLDVLLLGAGAYAQGFLDAVLQAGQNGFTVRVTAVSDQWESDREAYLRFRPALTRFIAVEGYAAPAQPYGYIRFTGPGCGQNSRFDADAPEHNTALLRQLAEEDGGRSFGYCFVSLGADHLNESVARQCAALFKELYGKSIPVFYSSGSRTQRTDADACPVWIREPLSSAARIAPDLEDMAFNTHLVWMGSNYDLTAVKKDFLDEKNHYYYASSLACALSIPYKLYALGLIPADAPFEPAAAAAAFQRRVLDRRDTDPEAAEQFALLVWYEHRRWLLEKLCTGWQEPLTADGKPDYEGCLVKGSVKDEQRKLHPCLVCSDAKAPLQEAPWLDHSRWDADTPTGGLDELDTMSVRLHRMFLREKNRLLAQTNLLQCDALNELRALAARSRRVFQAFSVYETALKDILSGSKSASRHLADHAAALVQTAREAFSGERTEYVKKLTKAAAAAFFPVIEANLYRDYKANDQGIVLHIPFILTNRPVSVLALPFSTGANTLHNVAAATVLNPAQLLYLYRFTPKSSIEVLCRKLELAVRYLCKRKNHCAILLVIGCAAGLESSVLHTLSDRLEALSQKYAGEENNCRIRMPVLFEYTGTEEFVQLAAGFMAENGVQLYEGSNPMPGQDELFTREELFARLRSSVPGIGCFLFDAVHKRFLAAPQDPACAALACRSDDSFLQVQDALLLSGFPVCTDIPEALSDIGPLRSILCGSYLTGSTFAAPQRRSETAVRTQQALAQLLSRQEAFIPLARLAPVPQSGLCEKEWYLPGFVFRPLRTLLQQLTENRLAGEGSFAVNHSSDTCRVHILSSTENLLALDEAFRQPHMLLDYYAPCLRQQTADGSPYYLLCSRQLRVEGLSLAGELSSPLNALLQALAEAGFVRHPEKDGQTGAVSFTFASPFIRRLLCSPAELLQCHIYCETLRTGYWNDIAMTDAVGGGPGLILSKGFSTLVCRCTDAPADAGELRSFQQAAAQLEGCRACATVCLNRTAAENRPVPAGESDPSGIPVHRLLSGEEALADIGALLRQLMEQSC